MEIKKISDLIWEIPKQGDMKVPARIYASEKLLRNIKKDRTLEQGMNVATLPGIIKVSLMMPDAHQGYGFYIGGVAAFDAEEGIITPGGIGFDINCGVRLLASNMSKENIEPKIKEIIDLLFKHVPSGVGSESKIKLTNTELDGVLDNGAHWAVNKGYGNEQDLSHCESTGKLDIADSAKVSPKAKTRGNQQLGTLGAGNHFLEIQYVDKIYIPKIAKKFGITSKGQIMVMIHCGSRGLGHQVCSDYLRKMEDAYPDVIKSLPNKNLIYAPFKSDLGQDYFKAMSASANYAWANRHIIADYVRKSFERIFNKINLDLVYDVAHNIAKIEEHLIDGQKRKLLVHRKGATRAFPPNHEDLPDVYKDTGQPVIIPGSMGTSSYVLVGTSEGMEHTFGSTAHGAGRLMSRHAAKKQFRGERIKNQLEQQKIYIKSASWKGIVEEAPQVYKDIDEVVKVSDKVGIGNVVARLKPMGVIKG